jgi:hypothetical protein
MMLITPPREQCVGAKVKRVNLRRLQNANNGEFRFNFHASRASYQPAIAASSIAHLKNTHQACGLTLCRSSPFAQSQRQAALRS